ncbi:hypothetical protein HMPREF1586_00543 [Gardnerella vaginalis JCP8522]|nr:hypothetical protein HMPREF1586_00543 [Gardnerella vaginalis JCP8522]
MRLYQKTPKLGTIALQICVMRTVQNARFVFGCRPLKLVRV